MLKLSTNTSQNAHHSTFEDINDEEMLVMNDCIQNIRKHVDRNIGRCTDAAQLARLLIFRGYISDGRPEKFEN